MPPALLNFGTDKEYKDYYIKNLCKEKVFTFDGIRVYFSEQRFWHLCCGRDTNGKKDILSKERAQYMSWIVPALKQCSLELYQGWNSDTRKYEPDRRVCIIFEGYIVIISFSLYKKTSLKANFVSAFYDTSKGKTVSKIRVGPLWDADECMEILSKSKKKTSVDR